MTDPTKQHAEREKALRKLIRRWLMAQDTKAKATAIIGRNPDLKKLGKPSNPEAPGTVLP
jgi:hypothetical protein